MVDIDRHSVILAKHDEFDVDQKSVDIKLAGPFLAGEV